MRDDDLTTTQWHPDITPVAPDVAYRGLPGTGKTTTLLNVLEQELDDRDLDDIAVSTYRRLMADDFAERAVETVAGAFDMAEAHHYIRTTHALAYRLCECDSDQIADADKRAAFADEFGIEYTPGASVAESTTTPLGNELFAAIDYARETLRSPTDNWRLNPVLSRDARRRLARTDGSLLARFWHAYTDWKTDKGLYDFTDLLRICVDEDLAPPVSVLIEDEFQDKTPLQVQVYNTWAAHADTVYVAGDPTQAIYSFQGTHPRYMEAAYDAAAESVTLGTSYRFGERAWEYATSVLSRAGMDVPSVDAVGDTAVEAIPLSEYAAAVRASPPGAFHLVRANYHRGRIAPALRSSGVPFVSDGSHGWSSDMLQCYNALARMHGRLARGDRVDRLDLTDVPEPEAKAFVRRVDDALLRNPRGAATVAVENTSLASALNTALAAQIIRDTGPTGVLDESRFRTTGGKEMLANAFAEHDGAPLDDRPHRITTIHGSKGRERPHVFLHDLTTPHTDSITESPEEARLWFVGATRPEEKLWIVRHRQTQTVDLPRVGGGG